MTCMTYGIPIAHMQYYTPDDGQKTCPKHVEFCSKNKFEKFVHLVGFIIRIYHDARSFECQKRGICVEIATGAKSSLLAVNP